MDELVEQLQAHQQHIDRLAEAEVQKALQKQREEIDANVNRGQGGSMNSQQKTEAMIQSNPVLRELNDFDAGRHRRVMKKLEMFKKSMATMTGGSGAIGIVLTDAARSPGAHRLVGGVGRAAPQHHGLSHWGPETSISTGGPVVMETDRDAIEAALSVQPLEKTERSRVVRIKNTLDIGEIQISETLLEEFKSHPDLEPVGELVAMEFDDEERLL